jgi:glycosyltransferase involved in cell wall biosynthesis
MTSVSEPFGLTPVEAAQHEVPLIIPTQAGVSEVLNHAIKVDFWDTDRIADAIIQVLSSPKLATQMVQATKFEMERASWGRAAQILSGYYQEVLQT